jgi:hypothetical protein
MKRIAIWLLIVVYLPQTMGIRMAIHFCAGDFDRIVFFDDSDSYCDCGAGMSKIGKPHKSCCKDIHVRCELKEKQIPVFSESIFTAIQSVFVPFDIKSHDIFYYQFSNLNGSPDLNSDPPLGNSLPLFIKIRVLRL